MGTLQGRRWKVDVSRGAEGCQTIAFLLRNDQAKQGQHGRDQDRLDVDPPRLATELTSRGFVVDELFSLVQIARTSRREDDSRIHPGLEDAQGSEPEGEEEADPPPAVGAGEDQPESDGSARAEHGDSHDEPLPPLSWTDVDGSAA